MRFFLELVLENVSFTQVNSVRLPIQKKINLFSTKEYLNIWLQLEIACSIISILNTAKFQNILLQRRLLKTTLMILNRNPLKLLELSHKKQRRNQWANIRIQLKRTSVHIAHSGTINRLDVHLRSDERNINGRSSLCLSSIWFNVSHKMTIYYKFWHMTYDLKCHYICQY